ncbi:MAG: fibrobacter succinogenes major paralogous domain-containing protein, partial [Paludibacteraceae bacterium]|nr:fibrobacter succinogenes major paralogous domain-containing protein [Paludibacteraceae bacterium]
PKADSLLSKAEASTTYQPKGNYLTEHQSLADYAKKSDIPTVPTNVSSFTNDAGYLTEHQSLAAYAKKSDLPKKDSLLSKAEASTTYQPKGNYLTEHQSLADYAKKSEIPTVPTKVSSFTNDANYITKATFDGIVADYNILLDKYKKDLDSLKTVMDKNQKTVDSLSVVSSIIQSSSSSPKNGVLNNHVYVDLGLPSGTKWASEDMSGFYSLRNLSNYSLQDLASFGYIESLENPVLTAKYDAATTNWGEGWRIPTREEWQELITQCNWKLFQGYGSSKTYLITNKNDPNGNYIIISSSTGINDEGKPMGTAGNFYYLGSTIKSKGYSWSISGSSISIQSTYMLYGLHVRPVCK